MNHILYCDKSFWMLGSGTTMHDNFSILSVLKQIYCPKEFTISVRPVFPFHQRRVKHELRRTAANIFTFFVIFVLFILSSLHSFAPICINSHIRPHFRQREKSVGGCCHDGWTTGTVTSRCFVMLQCGRTDCSWVVRQNNKPLSCHVNWSRINRLSIRYTYKSALSTPTHYIEWT